MKKLVLFAVALLTAGSAMAGDGTITFKTVNNEKDMLLYASPKLPEMQQLATSWRLIPSIYAQLDEKEKAANIGCNMYLVDCIATANDLKKGDTNTLKEGFRTQTAIPQNAKLCKLSLPGYKLDGNGTMFEATTYMRNTENVKVLSALHIPQDYEPWFEVYDSIKDNTNGFTKVNEPVNYTVSTQPDGMILEIPFSVPFIYEGKNLNVVQGLNLEDLDTKKDLLFKFAKTSAEVAAPMCYQASWYFLATEPGEEPTPDDWVRLVQRFFAGQKEQLMSFKDGREALEDGQQHWGDMIDFFAIKKNELPAFQFDFYTNDIRGTVTNENGPVNNQEIKLYEIDATGGKNLATTTTTDNEGKFEFLNLVHTKKYSLTATNHEIEEKELAFENIANDIEAEIKLQLGTGVDEVQTQASVKEVKYYNAQGIESNNPFFGVNVVVTTYDNGSKTISKEIK